VKPLAILLGALFTGASCTAAGLLLFQRLSLRFYREELYPYAFVTGSAIFSLSIFLLTAAGVVSTWTTVAAGVILIGAATRLGLWRRSGASFGPLPRPWKITLVAVMTAYGVLYLAYAMAPEASPDGSAYHLGLVSQYLRQHGFGRITTNMYANLSMGIEMLYIAAFSIGRHSSAAVVHLLFLLTLPLLVLNLGRRYNHPVAGVVGALLVYCSPVIGIDGSTAYIDVAMATVVFAVFCLVQIWTEDRTQGLLIPIGLLAGFAYACKLTAFLAVPYALGMIAYKLIRTREGLIKPLLITGTCAALMIAPWMIKNAIIVDNPLSPFFNRWFPNQHIRISFEEIYRKMQGTHEGITSPAQIPVEVTVRGGTLSGLIGPVFLLAPIALLSLRYRLARQALLAGALFASTYPANIGTRFLIASLPFFSLAMAIVLTQWRMAAPVLAFHALFSWPSMIGLYDTGAWRIDRLRWKQALRIESEDGYLRRMLPGYGMAQLVNQHVPSNGRVLTYGGVAEAYCEREILTCYQGGLNNMLCETWASGTQEYYLPARHWNFSFAEARAQKLRVVQTATNDDVWSVSEVRVLSPGGEIQRDPKWRIKASPNPWDVQLAFDGCPTTRWRAWQNSTPGLYLEIDFTGPTTVSGVIASISGDNPATTGRVDIETSPGRWQTVADKPVETPAPKVVNARRNAIDDIKRYGITHLVVDRNEFISFDLFRNQAAWGITLVGETDNGRLYRLD
jgi:hypothetical protein